MYDPALAIRDAARPAGLILLERGFSAPFIDDCMTAYANTIGYLVVHGRERAVSQLGLTPESVRLVPLDDESVGTRVQILDQEHGAVWLAIGAPDVQIFVREYGETRPLSEPMRDERWEPPRR